MIKPFAAAHRNAVITVKPLFPAGLDEFFTLSEEKFFEVDGRGAFLCSGVNSINLLILVTTLSMIEKVFLFRIYCK